jgi:hypothetical protein
MRPQNVDHEINVFEVVGEIVPDENAAGKAVVWPFHLIGVFGVIVGHVN